MLYVCIYISGETGDFSYVSTRKRGTYKSTPRTYLRRNRMISFVTRTEDNGNALAQRKIEAGPRKSHARVRMGGCIDIGRFVVCRNVRSFVVAM